MFNIFCPYSFGAVIQHEFDTDHLNIWLTFPLPMNINVKPDDTKWLIYVDNVEKTIASSEWQDEFRLLLVVSDIESLPDRVLVKYSGAGPTTWNRYDPDRKTLEMTWYKQYEPFGKILSQNITS